MQKELLQKLSERWSTRSPIEVANAASAPLFGTAGDWDLPQGVEPKQELLYLAVGIPDADSLPKEAFRTASERVLARPGDLAMRFVQDHTIANKKLMAAKDADTQIARQTMLMETAACPDKARAFLLERSMINCVRESLLVA